MKNFSLFNKHLLILGFILFQLILLPQQLWSQNKCSNVYDLQETTSRKSLLSISASKIIEFVLPITIPSSELVVPNDFFKSQNGEVVVGLDGDSGFFTTRYGSEAAEYLAGKNHADGKTVFYEKIDSPDAALDKLMEIYYKAGPIKRLLIFGHGESGAITIGKSDMNFKWFKKNKLRMAELPKDLFEKDAAVVLMSCSCASGSLIAPNKGINTFNKIFSTLLKRGGVVIASRQMVKMDMDKYDDPLAKEIKQNRDQNFQNLSKSETILLSLAAIPILGILAIEKGLRFFIKDWKTALSKESIVTIRILPEDQRYQ